MKADSRSYFKRAIQIAPLALVILGFISLFSPSLRSWLDRSYGRKNNPHILREAQKVYPDSTAVVQTYGRPISLRLPRVGISLDVLEGGYDNKTSQWLLDNQHAFWMKDSGELGSMSSIPVVYGHARKNIFGKLTSITKDEVLESDTSSGYRILYRFINSEVVNPENINSLRAADANIVLLTCSGPTYSMRELYKFKLEGVRKI